MLRDDAALRLRYRIPGEQPGALTIDTNLFPYDPVHQTFVNIYEQGDAAPAGDLQQLDRTSTPTTWAPRRARSR